VTSPWLSLVQGVFDKTNGNLLCSFNSGQQRSLPVLVDFAPRANLGNDDVEALHLKKNS
jgi:hypothetical protein